MKTKLISPNFNENFGKNLLRFRGITDVDSFLNPTRANLNDFHLLENCLHGAQILANILNSLDKPRIGLIQDCDVDGLTSSGIIYQYIKRINSTADINVYIHSKKQHGLEDCWDEFEGKGYDILIIPDAGSNDGQYIKNFNFPVIVIDHHLLEPNSIFPSNMILINNQSSPYPNSHLSGAGMAFQFCRALDEVLGVDYAFDYIDLAAVGICGDMMDGREIENQFFWKYGFSHIRNYFLQTLCEKQSFSMKNKINPISVAFYIVPLLNAMIRVGTKEEKQRLFMAIVNGHIQVPNNARGHKGEKVDVAIESTRECINARSHQNKLKDEIVSNLEGRIFEYGLLDNQILFIKLDDDDVFPSELTGLVAMQLSAKYKRPTIVARLNDEGMIRGSSRGINNSELESFKDFMDATGLFEYTAG